MDLVIGSGPSGFAAALGRLSLGRDVLMIDGGRDLEDEATSRIARLLAKPQDQWSKADRAAYQAPQFAPNPEGFVRRFGSTFAQQPASETLTPADWFKLRASRAIGGLSNVWGSAILPNRQADIADWPVSADDLAPHYAAVADAIQISGTSDDLERLLPAFSMQGRTALPHGPQASELHRRLNRRKQALNGDGVHFGHARQAVSGDCTACGMCLHGCPFGHITSTRRAIGCLREFPRFSYSSGQVVSHIDGTTAHLEGGATIAADRIFLAAGVLETARIMLRSQGGGRVTLSDSQHAFLPMLHHWRPPHNPEQSPHHTLSELFIEIDSPDISPFLVHNQLYTWNEFFAPEMAANYGKVPGAKELFRHLSRRLIVAQTFLHSAHSARVGLELAPDGRLTPTRHDNAETPRVLKAAQAHLARNMRKAGMFALGFAARTGPIGSGFHAGSTFPMAKAAQQGETDVLGQSPGLAGVHVVDASVLPSIPATTITFSVMANAHRIASSAPV